VMRRRLIDSSSRPQADLKPISSRPQADLKPISSRSQADYKPITSQIQANYTRTMTSIECCHYVKYLTLCKWAQMRWAIVSFCGDGWLYVPTANWEKYHCRDFI